MSGHPGNSGGDHFSAISIPMLHQMKKEGRNIVMITAYDATTSRIVEECGVDLLLVGDSAANVVHGFRRTNSITLDTMIDHCASVRRGLDSLRKPTRCLVIGDLPFGTYTSTANAMETCTRFIQEGQCDLVKLEGFLPDIVRSIVSNGIACVAHLGLQPQSVVLQGGFGGPMKSLKKRESGDCLIDDTCAPHEEALCDTWAEFIRNALIMQTAGASILVLECIPSSLAADVANALTIPVIGIGCGANTDGQVLVVNDILGLSLMIPKFAKRYANLSRTMKRAITSYTHEVRNGIFPTGPNTKHDRQRMIPSNCSREWVSSNGEIAIHSCHQSDRVLVLGGGSMGRFFSSLLKTRQIPFTLLRRHQITDWLSQTADGKFLPDGSMEYNQTQENDSSPHKTKLPNIIIVTHKTYQIDSHYVDSFLKPLVTKNQILVTVQNGFETCFHLENALRHTGVLVAHVCCNIGCEYTNSVLRINTSPQCWICAGPISANEKANVLLASFVKLINRSPDPFETSGPDHSSTITGNSLENFSILSILRIEMCSFATIRTVMLNKLVFNCAINGVCSIFSTPNRGILNNPKLRLFSESIVSEVRSVLTEAFPWYNTPGCKFPSSCQDSSMISLISGAETDLDVSRVELHLISASEDWIGSIEACGDNRCSTLQDIERGLPTEKETLFGFIVRLAKELAIDTPVTDSVYKLLNVIAPETQ